MHFEHGRWCGKTYASRPVIITSFDARLALSPARLTRRRWNTAAIHVRVKGIPVSPSTGLTLGCLAHQCLLSGLV